ncbi:transposase family protein [Streptomyces sp. NPDC058953]|uniref:transposase family protein n=1 Tax=unclassified Streptomyces TaxID=2593676 RepID=UPI0036B6538F
MDGTIAGYDAVGNGRADYSGKARRLSVNIQAVADPTGELIWYSPSPLDRNMGITAARTHGIITVCQRLKIPVLADKAYEGTEDTFSTPFKQHCGQDITTCQADVNMAHSLIRSPVELVFARLKQ